MTYIIITIFKRQKSLFQVVIILLLSGCVQNEIRLISEDQLIKRTIENKIPRPDEVKILNTFGDQISSDSLRTLIVTGKYFQDFYVNENDEIVQIIVRDKTIKDDVLVNKIKQKLNETKELSSVDIRCEDKVQILQGVFDRDQEMRTGSNQIDPSIDHENLEIVISFLEKCGMPTLQEVNDVQMAGIWAVLQHAPPKYQSKYIPLVEEAAKKGDIKWSVFAIMKDRALMYEGKAQIYGSQVMNGKLYTLYEPHYVNQRRREMNMEPLEDYLQKFGVEFDIEQKVKQ